MTILLIVYWAFLTGCVVYALASGGAEERRVVLALAGASLLSALIFRFAGGAFSRMELGILLVDVLLLGYLLHVALRTDRFWPLWTAGFHLIGVVTHAAKLVNPAIVPTAYALAQGFWAYPTLLTVCIGVRSVQIRMTRRNRFAER